MGEVLVNPIVYTMLGHVSHTDNFPSEDYAVELYAQMRILSSDDIVSLICSNDMFISYADQIKMAINGMDIKGIGLVLIQFIDANWPSLMQMINSSDAEFELFKSVVIKLVDEIRRDPGDGEIDGNVQG